MNQQPTRAWDADNKPVIHRIPRPRRAQLCGGGQ